MGPTRADADVAKANSEGDVGVDQSSSYPYLLALILLNIIWKRLKAF